MSTASTGSSAREPALLEAARGGDEGAYGLLVDAYRGELHAHCYRMLGSVHDAEDALQEALLRAWRGLPKFAGDSSLRSWLYRIATNTSLDLIGRRKKHRVLPIDYGPAADPHDGPGEPVVESVWIEPYADQEPAIEDGYLSPDARYEQRESVELAFIAALQHLPPNQRAVLILREVLGFSAKETADSLETSTQSVNSALQRARKTVEEKLPDQSQAQTLRTLGDEKVRELVEDYMAAWEKHRRRQGRLDALRGRRLLDAAARDLVQGRGDRGLPAGFADVGRLALEGAAVFAPTGRRPWRSTRGTPTRGPTCRSPSTCSASPASEISDVTAFIITTPPEEDDRERILRMPERDVNERALQVAFEAFELPERLD